MDNLEFRSGNEYPYRRTGPTAWIVSHLLRYPLLPIATLLGAVLQNFSYSWIQVSVGRAFDVMTSARWDYPALMTPALWIVGLSFSSAFFGLMRNYTMEFLAQRIERDSREELYTSLLGKSRHFHGRQRIGDIMARATNDVRALNTMINPGIMLILDSALAAVVPIIVIATISPLLLFVPFLFLLLFYFTIKDYNRKLNPVTQAVRAKFGRMNAGLAEAVSGIQVIKANTREKKEWKKFILDAEKVRDLFIRQGEIQARYLPMLMFQAIRGLAFFHALFLWHTGHIRIGEVVAFMGLIGALRFTTFISTFSFNLVQLGLAGAGRILALINAESELDENVQGHKGPVKGEVAFEKVVFRYPGEKKAGSEPILKDIDFRVSQGETIALVGRTGSGKTTLTRLLNRIYDADSGRVLIDGVDVRDWHIAALRSGISVIEQDVFLFSRTIAENIAFGCNDADLPAIERAAKAAQAHDFILKLEKGYDTVIGERGITLSGGQRQRIAIARAFLTRPRILILDDGTSAVDSETEDRIRKAIRKISRGRTTFLITHRLSQIRWADRILVLENGFLKDQGNHDELIGRCENYRRIFAGYG